MPKPHKNYITTWIYLDSPEEESIFPNNKGKSSSAQFQAVYWRCVMVFFESSLRFHRDDETIEHILFTNTDDIPVVDGLDLKQYFEKNKISLVKLENKYPLPQDYFKSFRNQFFEFSIIDHMASVIQDNDKFLMLDSDCVFAKPFHSLFEKLEGKSALTLTMNYKEDYKIHGITRREMKELFHELEFNIDEIPEYSGGELLLTSGSFIKTVAKDFPELYHFLLERNKKGLSKFNEEAHVLSYFYYREGAEIGVMNNYIKRMWTNRNHFRNIENGDEELTVWHMPNEKPVGFHNSYTLIKNGKSFEQFSDDEYRSFLMGTFLKASNHPIIPLKYLRTKLKGLIS